MTQIFVNLPVADVERSKAFYTAIGFTYNPEASDHNGACFFVEKDHSAFMLISRAFFETFTDRPIGDPSVAAWGATAVFLDTREAVDATVEAGLAAGGTEAQEPTDYGFMFQRQLTDPDGHIIDFGYLDPTTALAQSADAAASTQV